MKKLILTLALALPFLANAEDFMYKRGIDQEYTVDCTNPPDREDGSLIAPGELLYVTYYVDNAYPPDAADPYAVPTNPLLSINMVGGCTPEIVDLQQFPSNETFYTFSVATTTDGLPSKVSVTKTFKIQNANPNAPGHNR